MEKDYTWDQWMDEEDPGWRERKRALKYGDMGCMVRSLESLTGVKATEKEYDLRYKQLEWTDARGSVLSQTYRRLRMGVIRGGRELIDQLEDEEMRRARAYIKKISGSNSELGKALRSFTFYETVYSKLGIIQELGKGRKVLVIDPSFDHIFNAGIQDGRLISVSDGQKEVTLEDNLKCLVFEKKTK